MAMLVSPFVCNVFCIIHTLHTKTRNLYNSLHLHHAFQSRKTPPKAPQTLLTMYHNRMAKPIGLYQKRQYLGDTDETPEQFRNLIENPSVDLRSGQRLFGEWVIEKTFCPHVAVASIATIWTFAA
jgi:hypothetical protein